MKLALAQLRLASAATTDAWLVLLLHWLKVVAGLIEEPLIDRKALE